MIVFESFYWGACTRSRSYKLEVQTDGFDIAFKKISNLFEVAYLVRR